MRISIAGALAGITLLASAASAQQFDVTPDREPSFPRSGRIHGYLIDPAGQGLRGVVALCTVDGRELEHTHTVAMRRGRFEFDTILPGTYILRTKTVGPVMTDLVPGPDQRVTVVARRVVRPHLTAVPGTRARQ